MTADEAVAAVIEALDASDVPYMIVGSLASNFHGIPRATRDADFVIELDPGGLSRVSAALARPLSLDQQGAFEAVTATLRFIVRLEGSPFVCELFVRSDDPHDVERFRRRLRVRALDRAVWIATAEDMVVTKLRWALDAERAKDREDVRNMLAVRGDTLDWEYVNRWAESHGTLGLLQQIRASIPPL